MSSRARRAGTSSACAARRRRSRATTPRRRPRRPRRPTSAGWRGRTRASTCCSRDGSEVLVRAVRPEDKPLFVAGWSAPLRRVGLPRFLAARPTLSVDELAFFTEIDHVDHEAIGALDPATRQGRRRRALRARARAPARRRGGRDRGRRLAAPRARRQAAAAAVRARDREPHPGLHGLAARVQRRDAGALRAPRRGHRHPPRRADDRDRRRAPGRVRRRSSTRCARPPPGACRQRP